MERSERYQGCLLGLAVGDAVGTTLEFQAPGSFVPIDDMLGGGPFRLHAGEWTDDTSMALCLASSLVACHEFDARDQMQRYLRWRDEGYMASNGRCFDIGNTVSHALSVFEHSGNPLAGSTDPSSAGNGSLMRLAPVPLYFARTPEIAIELAGESSKTTHATLAAVDACRYFAGLLLGALQGHTKDELLSAFYCPIDSYWQKNDLTPEIKVVAGGSFKVHNPPKIQGTGYVVRSLEAALWAFYHSSSFREGCLLAVNLGNDADTTGAIYGQLAGAFYGVQAIPSSWLNRLAHRSLLEALALDLLKGSQAADGK